MRTIYNAGGQQIKVRAMMWLALLCAAGAVWWGIDLAQHYGLAPGDGGVLAPLGARLAWGISVGLLGMCFLAGMWLYGRCYATRVEIDEQAQKLAIFTAGFVGDARHEVSISDVRGGRAHAGRLDLTEIPTFTTRSVNAPWQSAYIAGWRLPLIIDAQGEMLDEALMERLFDRSESRKVGRPKGRKV